MKFIIALLLLAGFTVKLHSPAVEDDTYARRHYHSRTPTPTRTRTPPPQGLASRTPTPTRTAAPTRTPTNTPTATVTRTVTITSTATETPTASVTPTASATFTITPGSTPTNTATATVTRTPTITQTPSATPTRTSTPTITNTPSRTPTSTPTRTKTPTPSATPSRTATPAPTLAATATPTATATMVATSAAPSLALYNSHMLTYAAQNCNRLKSDAGNDQYGQPNGLNDTYYDAEWVFAQIADYTGDQATWLPCMAAAHKVYSQGYAANSGGVIPGYWIFPHGMAENWKRITPQVGTSSKATYDLIRANAPFENSSGYNDNYQGGSGAWYAIRESAYALLSHLKAPDFGETVNVTRANQLKGYLFTALDQTWTSLTATYRKPFMTALAAQALIQYDTQVAHDAGILPRIKTAADYMWLHLYISSPVAYPGHPSFMYTDDTRPVSPPGVTCTGDINDPCGQGRDEVPDLNLLIVPMFYWLYNQTGDSTYLTRGDAIWTSGVTLGLNLQNGKQFDQNYRWSMQGLRWRNGQ